ncbi:MAG: Flp pilus assembly complex ATPase component TadA [Rhodobacteraceae bacterium]|nr:Flp pilus assembly complex ATPase component TadA [Paracoccaceae bacterium]
MFRIGRGGTPALAGRPGLGLRNMAVVTARGSCAAGPDRQNTLPCSGSGPRRDRTIGRGPRQARGTLRETRARPGKPAAAILPPRQPFPARSGQRRTGTLPIQPACGAVFGRPAQDERLRTTATAGRADHQRDRRAQGRFPGLVGADQLWREHRRAGARPAALRLGWQKLGFEAGIVARLIEMVESPSGLFLVTGPTGSGKTTTLYTALSHLNTEGRKILTVEDPIEYNLPGIEQVQVHEAIGMTFARALRSFLRQDPNVIMVGEIRDRETAEIACRAALVGRMVLSTLHTATPEGA